MRGILSDVNIEGHVECLRRILEGPIWTDLWKSMAFPIFHFSEIGLTPQAKDAVVWSLCQQQQLVLVTANRNDKGSDSLEATIRRANNPSALPIFTLADFDRVRTDGSYAGLVAERLLEKLLDIDNLRGTGRLYLP